MSKLIGDVSAYAYAVSKGYAGTEEEFAELMADYAEVGQRAEDAADRAEAALDEFTSVTAEATTLPEGSSATAEYSEGHLTFGIPKGDKGDTGAKGDGAVYAVIDNIASVIPAGTDGYLKKAYTISIPITFYSGKDNVTGSVTSSDLYITRTSGGSGEMDTISGTTIRNVKTTTITYAIPAGWTVGNGKITLTVTIGTTTLTYYHAYTTAPTGPQGDKGDKGDKGDTGAIPNFTVGTVTTLDPDDDATATITGTAENPVLSFGIPKGDTGEVSQAQFDAALALKADAIGNYPDLAVGTAEQIDSDTVVSEDVAPYQFRQSISGASNRAYDKIVGGSLAVNQLFNTSNYAQSTTSNGITFTNNGDGTVTANGTATARANFSLGTITVISGHVYIYGTPATNNAERWIGNSTYGTQNGMKYMYKMTVSGLIGMNCMVASGATLNNYVFKPQFIDLTAMFGTTIADYIYSIETATAGAGVEWLKSHFPRIFNAGYIPYNAGELVSVQASAHKMTGFNQWDEEWALGGIANADGAKYTDNARIRSKNYIPAFPSTTYYFKMPSAYSQFKLVFYDTDKAFISYTAKKNETFVTPANCYYMMIAENATDYGTTYNHDICINISDPAKNGTYEPYKEHSYPLDDSLELRGLPKLDADNNLVYDGDVYESTGKVARKYGIVDLGTLNWTRTADGASGYYFISEKMPTLKKEAVNYAVWPNLIMGGGYSNVASTTIALGTAADKTYGGHDGGAIRIKDTSYTDAATFKAAMSGEYLVYELATPTTESAQPFTNPQVVDASGTEEYVTDSVVPVGHVTKYVENLKAKLEIAPASPTEDGDYIVRQTDGVNEYVPINSAPAITAKADVSELLKAFPVDTASGAIASFSDGAELPLKSLTVDIEPIQDLHGYDNPWPAGGGKNLFDKSAVTSGAYIGADGTITPTQGWCVSDYIAVSNGDYVASGYSLGESGVYLAVYDADKNYVRSVAMPTGAGNSTNVTIATGESYVRMSVRTVQNEKDTAQLEKGSTATAYAPYENICPISGHTQAVVTRTGKNLFDKSTAVDGYIDNSNGNISGTSSYKSTDFIPVVGGNTYYIKSEQTSAMWGAWFDKNKKFISELTGYANAAKTAPPDAAYMRLTIKSNVTGNPDTVSVNYPSTDTDYHDYEGQSITVQLGQTVYGGKLDVVSGELVIRAVYTSLEGATVYKDNGTYIIYRASSLLPVAVNAYGGEFAKCNIASSFGNVSSSALETIVQFPTGATTSVFASIPASVQVGTVECCYELATPITVTLTPNELSTLLGANNIWSDAGEVTAEYRADPTLFIQRKIAEALS